MTPAIYARYSSENQRPESIDDQVLACRRLAKKQSIVIAQDHIYADQAQSGARSDRPALAALLAAAPSGEFYVVLVDDLSRLARDTRRDDPRHARPHRNALRARRGGRFEFIA